MKNFFKILIILIICFLVYTRYDEIKILYQKSKVYALYIIDESVQNIGKNFNFNTSDQVGSLLDNINLPGPLKVKDGLARNARLVNLNIIDVIKWTNINRDSNGQMKALTENIQLNQSAQIKLDDMFKKQYFEHESPDGTKIEDLAREVSYEYITIGENLALGNFKDSESLVKAWMNSPGHRANILNKNYSEIGIAVGHGIYNGENIWLAVQHFGLPKSSCPSTDEDLRNKINSKRAVVDEIEKDLILRRERIENNMAYNGKSTDEQKNEYNIIIINFNKLVAELQKLNSTYNVGVRAFNDCLKKNT